MEPDRLGIEVEIMNVAFVHVPKTGGGSIKHWWQQSVPHHNLITGAHLDLAGILDNTDAIVDTSFTVVRNTWSRLISAYVFAENKARKKIRKRGQDPWAEFTLTQHALGIIPFLEWMRSIDHTNVRCQVQYSTDVEHVIIDHNPEQWKPLLDLLTVSQAPGATHRVQTYDPRTYSSTKFIDWVYENYSAEIQRFGFEPKHK